MGHQVTPCSLLFYNSDCYHRTFEHVHFFTYQIKASKIAFFYDLFDLFTIDVEQLQ